MSESKTRMLFLCTGNSCRSQMAEGFLREMFPEQYESLSAGANPTGYVNQKAVAAMAELGIDISAQSSKHIHEFLPPKGEVPDVIVSVCGTADDNCPVFPAPVKRLQWLFDDPHYAEGTEEEIMDEFRRVRDEIKAKLQSELGG
ncbi:MAG: arsenate reductase ArsC [Planctomycetaceae bacterium]|nr:arsenate reductase ArsC [Planctomycetaceae bacterium]